MNTLTKTVTALALGAFALGLAATQAQAQDTLPTRGVLLPVKGTKEINLNGFASLDRDKTYQLGGFYGQFLNPEIEVGGGVQFAGARGTKTNTTIGAIGNYHFRLGGDAETNPLLPYVGVFLGYAHRDDDSTSLGGQAGVKYFLNPNVALTAEYDFRSQKHTNGTNQIVLGFSQFFR